MLFILFCNFLLESGVSGPPWEMDSSSVLCGAGGGRAKKAQQCLKPSEGRSAPREPGLSAAQFRIYSCESEF